MSVDLISQIVDHLVGETLIGGRKAGNMVVAGQTASSIDEFKSLLAAKLREASTDGGGANKDSYSETGDNVYELAEGFMIEKIMMKPSAADSVKIGLTPGGDEIMLEETLTANQWRSITIDVIADGSAVNVYFTGITGTTEIIIYKKEL